MSLRAMLWALEHAPVQNPARLVVLLALADRASDDGTAAWPTVAWLAQRARCSERSVQRYLQALQEEDGVIRPGDQELVSHIRRDRRQRVWDLVMDARERPATGRQVVTPPVGHGVTAGAPRGDSAVADGVTLLSPEPSLTPYGSETVLEPSNAREAREIETAPAITFEAFYAAYPWHTGRTKAATAWTKAIKAADPADIVAGACRYAADPNRDPAYTKQPATWLNQGCWDDDPLPVRRSSGSAASQDHHDGLFDAARARAEQAEAYQAQMRRLQDERLTIGGAR